MRDELLRLIEKNSRIETHELAVRLGVQEVDIIKTLENFTVQDVVEKIQKIVKQRSLRINEFMKDYDPLRSGSITKSQFLSSLSMLKLYLSRKYG